MVTPINQNPQNFSAQLSIGKEDRIVIVKGTYFEANLPCISVTDKVGTFSSPLYLAPGLGCQIALQKLQTGEEKLCLFKSFLGGSVFYIGQKPAFFLDKALTMLQAKKASYWEGRGSELKSGEAIEFQGKILDKQQCFLKALTLSSKSARIWNNLGRTFTSYQKIEINGVFLNEKQCYVKAVELDKTYKFGWYNLGLTLDSNEKVNINEQVIGKSECFVRCIEIDDQSALTWNILGKIMTDREVIEIKGEYFNKYECLLKAISLDNNLALPWCNLGDALVDGKNIEVKGEVFDARGCYIRALELGPKFSRAWNNLGATLLPDQTVKVMYSLWFVVSNAHHVQAHPTSLHGMVYIHSHLVLHPAIDYKTYYQYHWQSM